MKFNRRKHLRHRVNLYSRQVDLTRSSTTQGTISRHRGRFVHRRPISRQWCRTQFLLRGIKTNSELKLILNLTFMLTKCLCLVLLSQQWQCHQRIRWVNIHRRCLQCLGMQILRCLARCIRLVSGKSFAVNLVVRSNIFILSPSIPPPPGTDLAPPGTFGSFDDDRYGKKHQNWSIPPPIPEGRNFWNSGAVPAQPPLPSFLVPPPPPPAD